MADNVRLSLGTKDGEVMSTDEVGGVHVQRVKVQFGIDGAAADVSGVAPLPVVQTDPVIISNFPALQSVSVGNFPALQDVAIAAPVQVSEIVTPVTVTGIVAPVDISNFPATQDVAIVDESIKVEAFDPGVLFILSQFDVSVASGISLSFSFTTPAGPTVVRMFVRASAGMTAILEIGEGSTPGGGVAETPIDKNREAATASLLTAVLSGVGGGGFGTPIFSAVLEARPSEAPRFHLAPSTTYTVRLESLDNNNPLSLNLSWSEV